MALDSAAIDNGTITPERGAQQTVSFTDTSAQASAFKTDIITCYSTQDVWIDFGSNPTAVADDGNSVFQPLGFMRVYRVKRGDKLAAIRNSNDGTLYINGGA